ncbi:hypothetical protein CDD81_219 [Ophiocordyceps australis]|uniref:SigF-like NTF2-like domain-containing protein n=1 Tax=Ophiocordyceps australis TaxID=1399860 RepID=A0A2C5YEM4_9HYPO|nr:hypothetical protein CDD81_219 [Ophiocordyceps australis]
MEHPVREIAGVIKQLTTGSPTEQEDVLNTYFLPGVSLEHPICRVPSIPPDLFPYSLLGIDSRWLMLCIYRWYRTISPHVDIGIDSAIFDQRSGQLFVDIHQTLSFWFIPFHKARVNLVTVLLLQQGSAPAAHNSTALSGTGHERSRYYIAAQKDYYSFKEFATFAFPVLGPLIMMLIQLYSAMVCVLGSILLFPLYLLLNSGTPPLKQHSQ